MNGCSCTAPTSAAQRSLAIVGSQMGMVGLRIGMSGATTPLSVGGVLIGADGLPVEVGGCAIGADGLPLPGCGTGGGGGTPGGVAVVPGAWNLTATPYARYTLQPGDTLYGLAITYLGSGSRVMEIWAVQDGGYKQSHTPSKVNAGDVINMPTEAADNAKKKIQQDGGGKGGKMGLAGTLAIGAGLAAAVAGVTWLATRKKKRAA